MASFFEYMYAPDCSNNGTDEKVVEDKRDEHLKKRFYLVECKDSEHCLRDLINYIAENGNGGHSFDIVVDSGDKEREKHFFWDGDGSDRIDAVVASTTGSNKELVGILLSALASIDRETWIEGSALEVDKQKLIIALSNIQNITRQILQGVDFEDTMQESMREIKHIVNGADSTEAKLGGIRYIAEEALS